MAPVIGVDELGTSSLVGDQEHRPCNRSRKRWGSSIFSKMSNHQRATRALLFMQQCRQQGTAPRTRPRPSTTREVHDYSSLSPENFGKKLRLNADTSIPVSPWRLPKQETPPAASTQSTSSESAGTVTSTATQQTQSSTNPYDFPRARDQPIPRYRHNPAITPGLWSFVKYRILRLKEPPNPNLTRAPAFNALTNPYRARKAWPPVLSQMSENQQFYYEKKFRRRLLKKTYAMRYNWDRWALFLRRFSIGFVIVWFALIAEPPDPDTRVPPDGLRYWMYGQLRKGNEAGIWPERLGNWIESNYAYYKLKHKRQWDPYNHDGWDETRGRNTLPGQVAPAFNRPLEDPTRDT